ncbi:hypothetical protein ACFL6C_01250 [Myxococcota bacterium]
MNLYWVETDDHHEDWFVIAEDEHEACSGFIDAEGYDEGDAKATLVAQVPADVECDPGWPSHELLEKCGAKILRAETPRVVEVGGRRFCEGMLEYELRQKDDDGFEAHGMERLNKTERNEET